MEDLEQMANSGWRYYNHALIPTCAPHETPDVSALDDKTLWKSGKPFLARWTTDFDSETPTLWWYCICDRPFDLSALKSKRRNVVKNAVKYCTVSVCDPVEYEDELLEIFNDAQMAYPSANRNLSEKDAFHGYLTKLSSDENTGFYLCFLKESGVVAGYAIVKDFDSYLEYQVQKVKPDYEKYQVNAALAYAIVKDNTSRLSDGFYICDGARNINHATHFQDYLEKYFGFRKAYCTLHIRYRKVIRPLISAIYPLRSLLRRFDRNKLLHQLNSVLRMEELRRHMDE